MGMSWMRLLLSNDISANIFNRSQNCRNERHLSCPGGWGAGGGVQEEDIFQPLVSRKGLESRVTETGTFPITQTGSPAPLAFPLAPKSTTSPYKSVGSWHHLVLSGEVGLYLLNHIYFPEGRKADLKPYHNQSYKINTKLYRNQCWDLHEAHVCAPIKHTRNSVNKAFGNMLMCFHLFEKNCNHHGAGNRVFRTWFFGFFLFCFWSF